MRAQSQWLDAVSGTIDEKKLRLHLELITPTGKRLGDCTFTEVGAIGRWYKELSGKTAEQLVLLGLNPMRFLSGEFKEGSTAEEIAAFKKWHKEHA